MLYKIFIHQFKMCYLHYPLFPLHLHYIIAIIKQTSSHSFFHYVYLTFKSVHKITPSWVRTRTRRVRTLLEFRGYLTSKNILISNIKLLQFSSNHFHVRFFLGILQMKVSFFLTEILCYCWLIFSAEVPYLQVNYV